MSRNELISDELQGTIVEKLANGEQVFYYTFIPSEIVENSGLPSSLIVGVIDEQNPTSLPTSDIIHNSLKVNSEFTKMLHSFCAEIIPKQADFIEKGKNQGEGWLYIIDQRTLDPHGQVPAHDILGALKIKNGNVGDYKDNPNYRVYSADGFTDLGPDLNRKFNQYMQNILRKEPR